MNQKEVTAIRDVMLTNRDSVELFASRGVSPEALKELCRLALKGASMERAEQVSKVDGDMLISHDAARSALTRSMLTPDKSLDSELRKTLADYITQQEARFVGK